jgi:hypothetical protein
MSEAERNKLAGRFIRALKASHEIFDDAALRKPKQGGRSPVNKALFEVWTVTMDKQSDDTLKRLKTLREKVRNKVLNFIRKDTQFLNSISQGTGDVAKVRLRFSAFRTVIEEAI